VGALSLGTTVTECSPLQKAECATSIARRKFCCCLDRANPTAARREKSVACSLAVLVACALRVLRAHVLPWGGVRWIWG
jgi:hypothetical protein